MNIEIFVFADWEEFKEPTLVAYDANHLWIAKFPSAAI